MMAGASVQWYATARMPRRRDPERRAALLARFGDHLLRRGMTDFSLRPAAAAAGTSPRMLLYYFGSKERLLVEAIGEIRARERVRLAREMQRRRLAGSVSDVVWVVWQWFSSRQREPYLRLFYELYALSAANPKRFRHFLDAVSEDYLAVMDESLRSWRFAADESRAAATLYLAAFRGLLLDLLTTGERARVDAAVKQLAAGLERDLVGRRPDLKRRHPLPEMIRRPGKDG